MRIQRFIEFCINQGREEDYKVSIGFGTLTGILIK